MVSRRFSRLIEVARHAEADHEEEQRRQQEGLVIDLAEPVLVGLQQARLAEDVEQADDDDQRGVLEQADEGVDDAGDRDLQRLRQDDQAHRLPVAQTHRLARLVLPLGNRLEAAADHLRHVGRREQRDDDHDPDELIERDLARQEDRQQDDGDEEQGDQRHAADEFDERDREGAHDRHARAPAERQENADGEREHDPGDAGDEVEHEAAELVGADDVEAEPADQQERRDHGIGEREPAAVARIGQVEQQIADRRNQQDDGEVGTPIGLGRVEAVDELVDPLVQPCPARALAGAILARGAGIVGFEKRPVDQRRQDQREQRERGQRQGHVQPGGEQVGPHPADDSDAGDRRRPLLQHLRPAAMEGVPGHRSTSAMRLLYQFM